MPDLNLDPDADDQQLLAAVVNYYHAALKSSPDALAYLSRRGITHPHVLDHFRLGFADRSLGLKLPPKQVKAGEAVHSRLQALGLIRPSGHEHFRGSVTVPVYAADASGQVADVYGRKVLDGHLRKGTGLPSYLTPVRRGVFNVGSFGTASGVIVTPSVFDALSFWTLG